MDEDDWLAARFQENRAHLVGVAYRMLGSASEADDAVQEAWLRLSRSEATGIRNLGGWLTTVVARVCLDMLRTRVSRREEPSLAGESAPSATSGAATDPEHEALLADSVGIAMLVVLDALTPAERLAFVLHDMFGVPFDEIAPIVGRSPTAVRQLASRARRRVHGDDALPDPDPDIARQRVVVEAFLAASRRGDFDALLAVLDPDVVLRVDAAAAPPGVAREVRGAPAVAKRARAGGVRETQEALVNGSVGIVAAPGGRLSVVLAFTISEGRIVEIDVIADPERLGRLDLAVLRDDAGTGSDDVG
jgi:RNA polymerase sigma-70 factor (ECF subfamily)